MRWLIVTIRLYIRYGPIRRGKAWAWDLARRLVTPRAQIFRPVTVRTRDGVHMRVDLTDPVQRRIYFWGEWEPHETRLLRQILKEGDVFIDVGAHVGYFSLLGARLVGEGGLVLAFEPASHTRALLEANVALNKFSNVRVLPYAVAAAKGKASFFLHDTNSGENSLRPLGAHICEELAVDTVTLDVFLPPELVERATVVKIDIEGAELLALQGMRGLLSRRRSPDVICEVTDEFLRTLGATECELISYMSSLGYKPFLVSDGRPVALSRGHGYKQYTAFFTKARVETLWTKQR